MTSIGMFLLSKLAHCCWCFLLPHGVITWSHCTFPTLQRPAGLDPGECVSHEAKHAARNPVPILQSGIRIRL